MIRFRIALDLGSDSTVAFVQDLDKGTVEQLDLQYFAQAMTTTPVLLTEGNRPSKRIRSRYAARQPLSLNEPLRDGHAVGEGPGAIPERLPASHATMALVDASGYRQAKAAGGGLNTFGRARQCLIRFFDDRTEGFELGQLLPNAKIVYQEQLRLNREFLVEIAGTSGPAASVSPDVSSGLATLGQLLGTSAAGGSATSGTASTATPPPAPQANRHLITIEPGEIIKNQLCLILENFVRQNPLLCPNGIPPRWDECEVILTVPNTYSPLHREQLQAMIGETLGTTVRTITESDAVVFAYYNEYQPNLGLTREERQSTVQYYVTIDIGRGTTDLSQVMLWMQRPVDQPHGNLRLHQRVLGRSGRASGGARMTHELVTYFERLTDLVLADLDPLIDRSPVRFTTASPAIGGALRQTQFFTALEELADWHKAHLDLARNLPVFQPLDDAVSVAAGILSDYVASAVPTHRTEISARLGRLLTHPMGDWRQTATPALLAKLRQEDARLAARVSEYVSENVDEVLKDLARSVNADNAEGVFVRNAVEALRLLTDPARFRAQHPELSHFESRTHVVVAGQASRFRPLRRRLNEVLRQAGYGELQTAVDPSGPAPEPPRRGLLARLLTPKSPVSGPRPHQNYAIELPAAALKTSCARGAIEWRRAEPLMLNPTHEHGQFAAMEADGGVPEFADMDRFNADRRWTFGENSGVDVARNVYYFPAAGAPETDSAGWRKYVSTYGSLIATTDATSMVTIGYALDGRFHGIQVFDGHRYRKIGAHMYGVRDEKDLYPLLWPAVLPDDEGSGS
ncbi:MAG: hypothetical protein SFX74_09725 [Fimbriimonadaceae bacterium]|nr:hypothetical protein [Fimbriimonadaceae bacterium]